LTFLHFRDPGGGDQQDLPGKAIQSSNLEDFDVFGFNCPE
jgi:hypothetical protein